MQIIANQEKGSQVQTRSKKISKTEFNVLGRTHQNYKQVTELHTKLN